jgi:adenylate cyclase
MESLLNQNLINSIQAKWPHTIILMLLVILFSSNAVGLIDFSSGTVPGLSLRLSMFMSSDNGFMIPDVMQTAEFISLTFSGFMLALLLPFLKPVPASLIVLLSTIPSIYFGAAIPVRNSLIPMEYSLLIILLLFGFNVLISYFSETHNKQKMINTFGQFIPPEVVEQITEQPDLLNLNGESKTLTIFFCDLVNFTGLSEQLNPKQLVKLLNEYFNEMSGILYKHGGTIDKYIGDSIMAFWGAPVPQNDHEQRAIMATFEMHEEIKRLSESFKKRGWPGPGMGIGINTGRVSVGNMGSKYRVAYTVIGDAVNLASRLQSMTRFYNVPTIVGEKTASGVKNIVFRELDSVIAKGKSKETKIYQPICKQDQLTEVMSTNLATHANGLENYYQGNYEIAESKFRDLLESTDDRYYEYMLGKINQLTS